jgi:chromosome partitioning protein
MVESRKRMHRETIEAIKTAAFNLLETTIPYSADIEKMGFHRAPLTQYRPNSVGAQAFGQLWNEVSTNILKEILDER